MTPLNKSSNPTGSGSREHFASQLRRVGWVGLVLEAADEKLLATLGKLRHQSAI